MTAPTFTLTATVVVGPVLAALADIAVPAQLVARWQLASVFQVRTLITATSADGVVVGVAFGVHRPRTAYEKLAGLWVPGGESSVVAALLEELTAVAVSHGAVAIKLELDPRSVRPVAALAAAASAFDALPEPVLGAALPHEPAEVPPGLIRWLVPGPARRVPYYRQSTDFTCGPVSVGMTLAGTGDPRWLGRAAELQLWREATTQYGCDPYGLAVGSVARGSRPAVLISVDTPILLEGATSDWERDTRAFLQAELRTKAEGEGLDIRRGDFDLAVVLDHVRAGGVAVLLIDEYPMHVDHCPHWVVVHAIVTATDGTEIAVVNDPWTDDNLGETWVDAVDLPIPVAELDALAHWGEPAYRSALLYPSTAST